MSIPLKVVVLYLCAVVVNSHLCMWSPMQRGLFDISIPGSPPCYRKIGPCGNITTGQPLTTLQGGKAFNILFQQNLNHYYVNKPGYLDASIALNSNPVEKDFIPIGTPISDYNAMNMITQTNFSLRVTIPNFACNACVLRVRYVSNNPLEEDHGTTFYQCADITIHANSPNEPPKTKFDLLSTFALNPTLIKSVNVPTPCCTMDSWAAQSYQTGSWRSPTNSIIYYNKPLKSMRVDSYSGDGSSVYDGQFIMYLNFTSGIEFYWNLYTNKCSAYGLDYWNDWCYGGPQEGESFTSSLTIGDSICNMWANGNFNFISSMNSCSPVGLQRTNGDFTLYYNVAPYNDPSVFNPPNVCQVHDSKLLEKAPREHMHLLNHPKFMNY